MTAIPLKLLLIEDCEEDIFFLLRILTKNGYDTSYTQIETADEMEHELNENTWDLIITDHTLPSFNAIEAIALLNKFNLDIPLIVLSGTIDSNIAVESMRLGARDFIMKDDTTRLIPAIKRELTDAQSRLISQQNVIQHRNDLLGLMNHSPAFIYIKDTDGRYTFINHTGIKLLNLKNDEITGLTDNALYTSNYLQQLQLNDQTVLDTLKAHETEDEVFTHDNKRYIFSTIKYPLFDTNNKIHAICGISTDITDRKLQEEKIRRSEKMDVIGQLSSGIAHDFNNQLGVVLGYLDIMKDRFPEDDISHKWIESSNNAATRCINLTRQLSAFSKHQSRERRSIDLNNVLTELYDMIQRSITPQIDVEYSLDDDLWNTEVDTSELQDVILNLVVNARDAMPDSGKLKIETRNITLQDTFSSPTLDVEPGEYISLTVSDTGTGMSIDTIEHIFEPFFTSKPTGKGTGLGLSMIYGFVRRYGGDISVHSELNVGSRFQLYLPRTKSKSETVKTRNQTEQSLPTGSETILIVEDEAELLQLADTYLSALGYKTHLADNGEKALEILAQNSGIELLFSDVVMPGGMNGYELARLAVEQQPDLKIIITTGFTSASIAAHGLNFKHSNNNLLDKPYRKSQLAIQVRNFLDQEPELE